MSKIVICHLESFTVPVEIIKKFSELKEAIEEYSNTFSSIEIWKQEDNYIVHENGIAVALYEDDLKLA